MKPRTGKLLLATLCGLLLSANSANAHTRWVTPTPRAGENIKLAPCGASAGAVVATYNEGGTITVTFNEFVTHSGYFGVAIANKPNPTSDADFTPLANPLPPPVTNPYPGRMNPAIHIYNTKDQPNDDWNVTFTLPAGMSCSNCVLQVIEYMMDAGPSVPPTLYHSCADVSVRALTGATPNTAPATCGE
jgi:hypothetical protein